MVVFEDFQSGSDMAKAGAGLQASAIGSGAPISSDTAAPMSFMRPL